MTEKATNTNTINFYEEKKWIRRIGSRQAEKRNSQKRTYGSYGENGLGMTLTISQMKDSKRFFHGSEKSDVPCQKPRAKQRDMK